VTIMTFCTRFSAILLSICQVVVGAETSVSNLLPGHLLFTPRAQPGTLNQQTTASQQTTPSLGLHILVIDSEDGINIIKKKTAVKPVVEVRDRNNLPVAGAVVIFSSPGDGPTVVFANGSHFATVTTDAQGRATALGSKPVNVGKFQLDVSASYQSETATLAIAMTNVMTMANGGASTGAGAGHGLSGLTIGIIAGVAGAAAIGLAIGLSHHGTTTTPTTAGLGLGSGATAGPP
jgi:hypothetical protein